MTRSGRSLLERRLADVAALDVEPRPFEPVAAEARHPLPRARVHPDPSRGWVRRVMPLLLVRKWSFGFALLCSLIALLVQVTTPRIVMATIDRALVARTVGIGPFVWAILGLAVARGVFNYLSRLWLFRFAYELEYDLRVLMYEHLGRQSFSFFDRVQTGQLISRAASDIRAVQMFLTFAPLMVLSAASFLLALVLMVQVHALLALVALIPLPFVYLTGARMRSLMFPVSWIVQARLAEVATVVEENISGVRVVKSFAAEGRQVGKLSEAAHRLQWATVRQVDVRARYAPLMEALPRLGMAGVLLYGGLLAIDGEVTVGAIVAFSAYVVMLQVPFRLLGFLMMLGQRAAASAERIYEVLDHAPEIVDRPGAVDLLDPRGEVEFRGVRFSYRDLPVLDGLDLRVAPGETLAVVGRTGCGKSTLVRLLARFYDVDDGAVAVDGLDVRDLTLASLRSHVGVVSDDPFLFAASIRDNIAYGRPDASLEDVREAARLAHADDFVEQLPAGYDSVVGERGYTLSGGQRQRLALARALLTDPSILVLDDATSSVDVKIEEEIHRSLRDGRAGRTTIVMAHRLSTISLADRVVLLEGGRVVADGTHARLMATEPRYVEVLARFEEEREETSEDAPDVAVIR